MSLSYCMRERLAVSSFFLERLTLISRLPGGYYDCELPATAGGSFSIDCSLVRRWLDEPLVPFAATLKTLVSDPPVTPYK